ncbi:hypothetical protein H4R20_006196, partial [Coemansia guatemalensis]
WEQAKELIHDTPVPEMQAPSAESSSPAPSTATHKLTDPVDPIKTATPADSTSDVTATTATTAGAVTAAAAAAATPETSIN